MAQIPGDQRAEADVAEVDDPGDAPALVDERVVEGEVAVDDLGRAEVGQRGRTRSS